MSLQSVADAAVASGKISSAAIFVVPAGGSNLVLAAAAGISGDALDRLVSAVGDASHPIARTVVEEHASFDVTPMAPGGPALRSHIPIVESGSGRVVGVLAVAHDERLDETERAELTALAASAAAAQA